MRYRISLNSTDQDSQRFDHEFVLTDEQFQALANAIKRHNEFGYRDGETRLQDVTITELGEPYPSGSVKKEV